MEVLTAEERGMVRYHLGYPNISPGQSLAFGSVVPVQTVFLLESNMNNLMEAGLTLVRQFLCTLKMLECRMAEAAMTADVVRVSGGTELDKDYVDRLEKEIRRWAGRLADTLACPYYPFAERFEGGVSGRVQNIPVSG